MIFTVSLIVQSVAIKNNQHKLNQIYTEQTNKDGGIEELTTLAYLIRENWSISQKNDGWFDLAATKPDVFKQKVANVLNIQKFTYLEKIELKEITKTTILLTAVSKQIKEEDNEVTKKPILYTLSIEQKQHKITLN